MISAPHIDARQTPRLARLQAIFDAKHRLARALAGRALAAFGPGWAADFEEVLSTLCPDDMSLEAAAKGYSAFAFDSMRRQKTFEVTREYPNKTYAEAAGEVYFNDEHMSREYLPGLLLSHFLWLHHYRQIQFFDTAFVGAMRASSAQHFAEVGVGTAVYSRRILSRLPGSTGAGYDISPSSCRFARQHVEAAGALTRYAMHEQDVVAQPIVPVPWLVCVEVLEHLEQPVTFLAALRKGLAPGGKAFITAALNAAHADHIYLYRNAEEVWQHLSAAGFTLEQSFLAAAYPPPAQGVPVPLAAAFVVA
ncbi:MAG: class I SAM-dependent methyltransferase [Burkholderiaceae bacterium]